jgi:hypothetical protein
VAAANKVGMETVLSAGGCVTIGRRGKDGTSKVTCDTGSPDQELSR